MATTEEAIREAVAVAVEVTATDLAVGEVTDMEEATALEAKTGDSLASKSHNSAVGCKTVREKTPCQA